MNNDEHPNYKPARIPLRLGVSACLLGHEVRYDGQHRLNQFIVDDVTAFAELVPVCPEVEVGLGTPREPINLTATTSGIRLLGVRSREDLTDRMAEFASGRVAQLCSLQLSGYILKKDSPSCGMERVKIWHNDMPRREGRGVFAAALIEQCPLLPIEEEGRLNDPVLRENFFERVFALHRLQNFFAGDWTVGSLVEFHTSEKLLLSAHDESRYRQLGRLVAKAKGHPRDQLKQSYLGLFMNGLKQHATFPRNCNTLQHMMGFFRPHLTDKQRHDLLKTIEDFRSRLVPLSVPLTLFKHYADHLEIEYLQRQTYLQPFPKELMLRNYVTG